MREKKTRKRFLVDEDEELFFSASFVDFATVQIFLEFFLKEEKEVKCISIMHLENSGKW